MRRTFLHPEPRTGPNTILHLKLHDGPNWTTTGPVLHVFDYSLNNHPGTLKGTAKLVYPGVDLDGDSDYIEVADHADFSFGDASDDSPLSIVASIYMDEATDFIIVSKYATDNKEWFFKTTADNILVLQVQSPDGTNKEYIVADDVLVAGRWYRVAATYDGRGGATASTGMTLYVSGVKIDATASGAGDYVAMDDGTAPVWIGRYGGYYAAGLIDDVMIFKRELSALDALNDYNLTKWRYGR